MQMYDDRIDSKLFNICIDGFPLIGEELSPNESFNRRETSRKNIIGGTQTVMRTSYVHRDFSFVAHVRTDPEYPDVYDETFKLWQSKEVEVISKEMGGKFGAECIVKKKHETPNFLTLEIQLIEIPGSTSLIPDDEFIVPTDKVTTALNKNNKSQNISILNDLDQEAIAITKRLNKTRKNTKKTNKKSSKKSSKKKKKGNNITKVTK